MRYRMLAYAGYGEGGYRPSDGSCIHAELKRGARKHNSGTVWVPLL